MPCRRRPSCVTAQCTLFDLVNRALILCRGQREIMPLHAVFHKGDAATFAGAGDDCARSLLSRWRKRRLKRVMVVPVYFIGVESEGFEFLFQWIEIRHILCRAESLQPVDVDDQRQIAEPIML